MNEPKKHPPADNFRRGLKFVIDELPLRLLVKLEKSTEKWIVPGMLMGTTALATASFFAAGYFAMSHNDGPKGSRIVGELLLAGIGALFSYLAGSEARMVVERPRLSNQSAKGPPADPS